MNQEDLARIYEQGPGQFLEMVSCYRTNSRGKLHEKTRKEILQAVAESLTALANAGGGTVLLGADTEGGAAGVFFDAGKGNHPYRGLKDLFHPSVPFQMAREEVGGKTLLRFTVPPSPVTHVLGKGRGFLRVGPANVPLSRERIAFLRQAKEECWHEREVLPGSSIQDLDRDLVDEFLSRCGLQGDPEKYLYRPYGLLEYREGKALLNRAAVYLFGKDPLRWHPRPGLEIVCFEGNGKGGRNDYNVVQRTRIEAPLLKLVQVADREVAARVRENIVSRDLFYRERIEYPSFVWREALINALVHRDYSLEGSAAEVWMFRDRVEIRSPGKVPGPARQRGGFLHYARNPLMARALTDAGFMRSLGEGIFRINQEMERHGLNAPEWKEEGNLFSVIFRNAPILDESTSDWLKRFEDYRLNLRQKRILAYAKVHGGIFSSSDYQKFGVDRDGAYTEIKTLMQQGIVAPLKKHGKVYRVKEGSTPFLSLPWIVGPLREKGSFAFQELNIPGSMPREKARGILRNLTEGGYLTSSGRGRTLRYLPAGKWKDFLENENLGVSEDRAREDRQEKLPAS